MDSDKISLSGDFQSVSDIKLLAQLLKPEDENSTDSEDDALPPPGNQKLGPGDICPKKPKPIIRPSDRNVVKGEGKSCEEIRQFEDNLIGVEDESELDGKETPEYNIVYKQAVTSEDVFLQMNCKTPATSSCEDIILTINLPGETSDTVELTLTKDHCLINARKFKLSLPLPHQCDPDLSKAQFISDLEQLKLNIRMVREFDYVNF